MIENRAMLQAGRFRGPESVRTYADLTDDSLVLQAMEGSEEAFGELAQRYRPLAVRTATSVIGPDKAEDVVQDALILAYRALATLHDPNRFPQWLGTITRFRALRIGRTESRRRATLVALDGFEGELPARHDSAAEVDTPDLPRLEAALLLLPATFARVLRLHFLEGVPHQKIAERLGISLSTSKWRCYRGKQLLRTILRTEDRDTTLVERGCDRCRSAAAGVGCEKLFDEGAEGPRAPRRRLSKAAGDRRSPRLPSREPTLRDDLPPGD